MNLSPFDPYALFTQSSVYSTSEVHFSAMNSFYPLTHIIMSIPCKKSVKDAFLFTVCLSSLG